MENPNPLGTRREPRYVVDFGATINPSKFLSKVFSGQVVDLSRTGVSILTNRMPRAGARAKLTLRGQTLLKLEAILIWSESQPQLNGYYSGWKFINLTNEAKSEIEKEIVNSSKNGNVAGERRKNVRRNIQQNQSMDARKEYRRLTDLVAHFDLLEPTGGTEYRRSDERRTQARRQNQVAKKIHNRRRDRRDSERRAEAPSHDLGESALARSVRKVFAAFRDYLIFWLPSPLARKMANGRTFAFITHPRDTSDVCRQYPFAKLFPDPLIKIWLRWQWPVIGAEIQDVVRSDGSKSRGWLIFCPLTAKQMIRDREFAKEKVIQTVRFAEKVGAKIVGLGAFTSIVTRDGKDVADKLNVGVTTGNALSAAVAIQNIVKMADLLSEPLESCTLAIVGAGGNVGSVCARNFYGVVKKLILVDINKRALTALHTEFIGKSTELVLTLSIEQIITADFVIAVTNAPGAIVKGIHLKKGAVVVDAAQPKNVSENIPHERSDVLVVESAILKFPNIKVHFDLGIGPKEALGCMAETIVLDAVGWHKHFSIGNLSKEQTQEIMAAARTLGLEVAHFRNSTGYLKEGDIKRIRAGNLSERYVPQPSCPPKIAKPTPQKAPIGLNGGAPPISSNDNTSLIGSEDDFTAP